MYILRILFRRWAVDVPPMGRTPFKMGRYRSLEEEEEEEETVPQQGQNYVKLY